MTLRKADFTKICRICLLFRKEMMTLQLEVMQLIKVCVDIEVQLNDGFPQTICLECFEQLRKFIKFRQLCRNSNEILHKIINENVHYDSDSELNCLSIEKESTDSIKDEIFDDENVKVLTKTELRDNFENRKTQREQDSNYSYNLHKIEENEFHIKDEYTEDHQITDEKIQSEKYANESKNNAKTIQQTVHCTDCNKYILQDKFENHSKRHRLERKYKCDLCLQSFKMPFELAKHLQIIHRSKKNFECHKCNKKFCLQIQLDMHLKLHFKTNYTCNICNRKFSKKYIVERHRKIHENREKIYCLYCNKTFFNENYLKRHVNYSHKTKRKTCPVCGKNVLNVKNHIKYTHEKTKPFKCDHCSKAFVCNSYLLKHFQTKHKNGPFKCNQCNEIFNSNTLLLKHNKIKHLAVRIESKALCPVCGKICQSQYEVQKHLETHDDNRKFDCHLCNKTYKSQGGLRRHLMVHKGIRPFSCSSCSKRFFSKIELEHHLLIHTGERPFVCDICGRAFTQKASRQTHMKVHNVFIESKNMLTNK